MPGLVLPPGIGEGPAAVTVPATVPPPEVAAALAVHADPVATVLVRPAPEGHRPRPPVVCVSIGHPERSPGLASSLVVGAGAVQIALVPLTSAVDEVVRHLPRRSEATEATEATGPTGPTGPGLVVQVVHRDDAVPRWERPWATGAASSEALTAEPLTAEALVAEALVAELTAVLAGCLSERPDS
jgi:hypothetical protein